MKRKEWFYYIREKRGVAVTDKEASKPSPENPYGRKVTRAQEVTVPVGVIAFIWVPETNNLYVGASRCGEGVQFRKSLGRDIAMGGARQALHHNKVCSNMQYICADVSEQEVYAYAKCFTIRREISLTSNSKYPDTWLELQHEMIPVLIQVQSGTT